MSGYAQGVRMRQLPWLFAVTRRQFVQRAGAVLAGLAGYGVLSRPAFGASTPAAPTGLTGLSLDGKVVLSWVGIANATYSVYRGTPSAPDSVQLASGLASTTYVDASASNGSTYVYSVRATSAGASSGDSNLAEVTPLARGTSSGNAIALENSFPGSTAWKLEGRAQAPTGLEGFATAISIDAGDSVDLKVTTADGAAYRIEIYRVGYYGGDQARLISVCPGLVGVDQPDPQEDDSTGLIDCSNWTVTSTITTTPDWPTGIYLLRLARADNGTDNHILLVVRNDGQPADIGYALSVTTYQAYNDWGGRSLYTFNSEGDDTVADTPRAVKVSFDRPFNQSLDESNNFFTQCDIQNVSWLEQQGYDISYMTGVDVHEGAALGGFGLLISPAHDEYWSAEMRSAFTSARDGGTSLAFLGANGVYWKIRFEDNPYSGTANRVQVCYKTIESGGPDPSGDPTTTWRDPVVNEPENALIGQMYIGDNDDEFYPLVVTGQQAQNRVWRYTDLTSLEPDESTTIGQYLLGWEWDARVSNGCEPAGVTTIAASPATGELLLDAGHTYNPSGSAISNGTTYRAASGAWVFATGTNQWSRGLGVNIDGTGEPSPIIQQATMNVLADMGARATTPAEGLVQDPIGAPNVTATNPATGVTVAAADAITATFDRDLDPSTVTDETFTLSGPDGAVEATVSYDGTTQTVTLTPGAPIAGAAYTATLTAGIEAIDGSPLAAPYTWTFTVGDGPYSLFPSTAVPAATGCSVQDGRSGSGPWSYELGVKVEVTAEEPLTGIRFYKDAAETGTHIGSVWNAQGQLLAQTTFQNENASGWQEQDLSTPLVLEPDQVYTVSVGFNAFFVATTSGLANQIAIGPLQSVADGANGVFGSSAGTFPQQTYSLSNYFVDVVVAGKPAPPQALTVTGKSPADGSDGAGSRAVVSATFSAAIDPTSLTAQTFDLTAPDGTAVSADLSYDSKSSTASLTPAAPLQPGTAYTASIGTGIQGADGSSLSAEVTWSFTTTTGASLFTASLTPALVNLDVQDGRSGSGPFSYELGVKIQVDSSAQLTAIRFYKDSEESGTHVGRVWSASGTLLTQVTFASESSSGWQEQTLPTALPIDAGSVYVVSVNANSYFVDTRSGLASAVGAAPLSSVTDGQNGVFAAAAGTFPQSSYSSSNYFVDMVVV